MHRVVTIREQACLPACLLTYFECLNTRVICETNVIFRLEAKKRTCFATNFVDDEFIKCIILHKWHVCTCHRTAETKKKTHWLDSTYMWQNNVFFHIHDTFYRDAFEGCTRLSTHFQKLIDRGTLFTLVSIGMSRIVAIIIIIMVLFLDGLDLPGVIFYGSSHRSRNSLLSWALL